MYWGQLSILNGFFKLRLSGTAPSPGQLANPVNCWKSKAVSRLQLATALQVFPRALAPPREMIHSVFLSKCRGCKGVDSDIRREQTLNSQREYSGFNPGKSPDSLQNVSPVLRCAPLSATFRRAQFWPRGCGQLQAEPQAGWR